MTSASVSASSADGRLVEDQDRRVAQDGARDRDAQLLALGQRRAALADDGVEPSGRRARKSSSCASRAACDDLARGSLRAARRRCSRAPSSGSTSGGCSTIATCWRSDAQRELAHVDAVEQHAPGGRVVEARDQAHERRLAGARRADDRHHLPGPHVEVDAAQHRARRRRTRTSRPRRRPRRARRRREARAVRRRGRARVRGVSKTRSAPTRAPWISPQVWVRLLIGA